MEGLVKKRAIIKGSLTRFVKFLECDDVTSDLATVKLRLERIIPLFDRFEDTQTDIDFLCVEDTDIAIQSKERSDFESLYFKAVSRAQQLIKNSNFPSSVRSRSRSRKSVVSREGDSISRNVYLPKINIPKFDGNYSNWVKFRDTFKSLVHETNIKNIQKFHYLNDALIGDAERAISALGISDSNYEEAWKALEARYEDANELIHHHVSGLFDAAAITRNLAAELRQLIDTFNNHLLSLKALKEPVEHWDTLIIHLLSSKLNSTIRNEWEKFVAARTYKATLKDMTSFLENHCKFLIKTGVKSNNCDVKEKTSSKSSGGKSSSNNLKSYATIVSKCCILCKGEHQLFACEKFKTLSPFERVQKVKELGACFNCLSTEHKNRNCKSGPCKKCGRKHNTMLHLEKRENSSSSETAVLQSNSNSVAETQKTYSTHTSIDSGSYVLLATAQVYLFDELGNKHECRAMLDSCSQPHITSDLCKRLGLRQSKVAITLSGIEQGNQSINYQTTIKMKSRVTEFSSTLTCIIVDQISDNLPSVRIRTTSIEIPKGIELADPSFNQSKPVDLLIGAALFYQLLCVGQIQLYNDQPIFQKTLLGWVATGNVNLASKFKKEKVTCHLVRNEELNAQLKRFWEIENPVSEINIQHLLKNDPAEQHFKATTERTSDGRFLVSIPFKQEKLSMLSNSKDMAFKRLLSMERKFAKYPSLKEQYSKFMEEYEELGHMTEVPASECNDNKRHFYLPHHAVIKEESTTTKLRVVFDGSAKTTTGISLNDAQHIGVTTQDDLFSIFVGVRRYRYALSADVAKMYRQILVRKNERSMQRILWRPQRDLPVKVYELNTVTYGEGPSSFLATRCLYELGIQNKKEYPVACEAILHNFYVDDLWTGATTIEEAIQLKKDLNSILSSAGLELRKWASNEPQILLGSASEPQLISIHGDKYPKTLGLVWYPKADTLKYRINKADTRKITKRTISSIIAQIFDPLGLIGPAIINAKVIMQKLWSGNFDWDESLPQEIHTSWTEIYNEIMNLNRITVDRFVLSPKHENIEYHGFCDASEKAYGACIYICSVDKDGTRSSKLLCAKSRVAPLKAVTIPRLELLGAVLLAELAHKVAMAFKVNMNDWYFWTDSMVALAWIRAPSSRWKTFVANRTAEIQELTNDRWNHVRSEENPADIISRGMSAAELHDSTLWWNGPFWLSQNQSYWPSRNDTDVSCISEEKKKLHSFISQEFNDEEIVDRNNSSVHINNFFERFSSFNRMVRVAAYIFKFIKNCKSASRSNNAKKNGPRSGKIQKSEHLKSEEIQYATTQLLKLAQSTSFPQEISALMKNRNLPTKSSLNQLTPFLDESGVLRVGGRLQNAKIHYDHKHPIILASNHKLTFLILKYEHLRLLHAGCQTVLSSIRKKFWILSGKSTVKRVLHGCVICFKARPSSPAYIMGNLPSSRVTPRRAFYNCGVDYAGPIIIKEKNRSRVPIKAYLCIFVCFSTKAIHIELATDVSTEAFMNCFKRFISRRGKCQNIYSDNGRNFIGAKNELNELRDLLSKQEFQSKVHTFLVSNNINWHLIPPHAPNFGGLWESAVKSVKYHLKRVLGETRLTFEELYTLLTQIEAILNSRPLTPLSDDPNDFTPLTPSHFLIGDLLTALPQPDLRDMKTHKLNRFQHLQQMLQHFWQRWHDEYLSQLQARKKWKKSLPNAIKPGSLILIRDNNTLPMHWPLGRVIEIHPGKDNIIRVVSIKTATGIIKRPTSKICILPIEDNQINFSTNDSSAAV